MTALRKSMGPVQADRLLMALSTYDLIEAVNVPLRVRRGFFAIDYMGHTPTLYVICAGCEPERLAFIDTRRRCTVWDSPKQQALGLMVDDVFRRLESMGASLAFIVQTERGTQRSVAKLQITSADSRNIAMWLAKVPRKTRQSGIGPFVITEGV